MLKHILNYAYLLLLVHLITGANYDFHLFVLQWKPSQCLSKKSSCSKNFLSNDFSIHGLWPEFTQKEWKDKKNPVWPEYCHQKQGWAEDDIRRKFVLNDEVTAKLKRNWNSRNANATEFWLHEWEKHGTCFEPNKGSIEYFKTVLRLFDVYNVEESLRKVGIEADNELTYTEEKFKSAFGFRVGIKCKIDKKRVRLDSVVLCLDLELNQIDCREDQKKSCNGDFIYPLYEPGTRDL